MSRYSKEFKDTIIKQMMPPNSKTISDISKETGVSVRSLFRWIKAVKAVGNATPSGETSSKSWSSEDKFLIVLETAKMSQAELADYCRARELYVEQIDFWKHACFNAYNGVAEESKVLKKDLSETKKEVTQLSKELHTNNAVLAETTALLILRKKALAFWGDEEED
jgi:hypothetical protein